MMAYKDKDKQREANAERQRRYKERQKALSKQGVTAALCGGVTGMTPKGVTSHGITDGMTLGAIHGMTKPKRGKDIKYKMTVMERLFYKPAHLLKPGETNFVSLPGRACYGVV